MGEDKPSPLAAYRVRLQCLGESTDDHTTITSHNHESSTSTFLSCEGWVKHAAGRHLAFPRVLAFALALCARCTGSGLATLVLLRCVAKGPPHDSAFHSASHSACHFFFACHGARDNSKRQQHLSQHLLACGTRPTALQGAASRQQATLSPTRHEAVTKQTQAHTALAPLLQPGAYQHSEADQPQAARSVQPDARYSLATLSLLSRYSLATLRPRHKLGHHQFNPLEKKTSCDNLLIDNGCVA